MKANELMIGDWVMINPISYYQVEQIRVEFGELRIYLKGTEVFATENEIMPIPLTPEILEKNGIFKHKFEGHLEECYSTSANPISNEQFILWEETDRFELVLRHIVDNLTYSALRCKVRYVHELQHALRVCGIEKTIEL